MKHERSLSFVWHSGHVLLLMLLLISLQLGGQGPDWLLSLLVAWTAIGWLWSYVHRRLPRA